MCYGQSCVSLQGSAINDKTLKDDKITEVTKQIQGIKCATIVYYIYYIYIHTYIHSINARTMGITTRATGVLISL
jgi:hypothetical protein